MTVDRKVRVAYIDGDGRTQHRPMWRSQVEPFARMVETAGGSDVRWQPFRSRQGWSWVSPQRPLENVVEQRTLPSMTTHTDQEGQACASCQHWLNETTEVALLESGDVVCKPCATVLSDFMPDEIADVLRLEDVHEDWRVR